MRTLVSVLVLLATTVGAQTQCGPYGDYPCGQPRPYYGPYAVNPPKPPPVIMPCPNCGRNMIRRQVWQPGRGWVTIYVCPECN